jgi:hypothetical protein
MVIIQQTSFGTSSTNSLSFSLSIGSQSNRIVVVGVSSRANSALNTEVVSVTINGINLIQKITQTAVGVYGTTRSSFWYISENDLPVAGNYTININTIAAQQLVGIAYFLSETNNIEAQAANSIVGNHYSINQNISTIQNDALILDMITSGGPNINYTPGFGQTEITDLRVSYMNSASSYKFSTVAGIHNMEQTYSNFQNIGAYTLVAISNWVEESIVPNGLFFGGGF